MSPKYNADTLSEPIEITLEGKDYKVGKITTDLLTKVTTMGKDKKDLEAPIKQLACLLGVEVKELKGVDLRKISGVLKFITESVTGEEVKKKG